MFLHERIEETSADGVVWWYAFVLTKKKTRARGYGYTVTEVM